MAKYPLSACRGYTLVEVLVAIMVMAIVMSSIILSVQEALNQHHIIKEKQVARWIARDVISEYRLGLKNTTNQHDQIQMLGQQYHWHVTHKDSFIPNTKVITVHVTKKGQQLLTSLDAFVEDVDAILSQQK